MRFEVGVVVIFVATEDWVMESGRDENEVAGKIMVERDKMRQRLCCLVEI